MTPASEAIRDRIPSVVMYGDFNCPFSAVAHARAERLAAAGRARVDWRCVEHDPTIGPNETQLTAEHIASFEGELARIDDLLDDDEPNRFRVPSRRLKTRHLNLIHAATSPMHRPALRTALFEAYWFDDRDLSSDQVVDAVVRSIDPQASRCADLEDAVEVHCTIDAWQRAWSELPRPIVPVLVTDGGYVSRGLGALARLANGCLMEAASGGTAAVAQEGRPGRRAPT